MSKFEEVCLLSCEKQIDSLPDVIPEHKFSKNHNRKMKELIGLSSEESKHRVSKNTIRFLLIAAILLAVATTAIAVPSFREFTVNKFFNHSEYEVKDKDNYDEVDSPPILNYIPNDFVKTEDYGYLCVYKNDDKEFIVEKMSLNASILYDTEKYDNEIIEINGIEAVYYRSDETTGGIIFNNGKYIYSVDGNIGKDELVKIAQNIDWFFVGKAENSAFPIFLSQNGN